MSENIAENIWRGEIMKISLNSETLYHFAKDAWAGALARAYETIAVSSKDTPFPFAPPPFALPAGISPDDAWPLIRAVRGALNTPEARGICRDMARDLHLHPAASNLLVGVPSFRLALPRPLQDMPAQIPALSLHRDTWYGLPTRSINVWVPLGDADCDNGVEFFPEFFQTHVSNTSDLFSYDAWKSGDKDTIFPSADHGVVRDLHPTRFLVKRGEALLFSSQHLHRTAQRPKSMRASIDFRVLLPDNFEPDCWPKNIDSAAPKRLDDFFD